MKQILSIFFFLVSVSLYAQWLPLVQDNYSDSLQYIDLSKKITWGSYTQPASAFRIQAKSDRRGLSFPCLGIRDSAFKYSGFNQINSLKASSCVDYPFSTFDRDLDSLQVEFDLYWDSLIAGGNQARVTIALMKDYNPLIPFNAALDSISAVAPFGRPAYSFRILARRFQGTNNYANMQYGGGTDTLGEFEKTASWWLPGFISGPGGISPESPSVLYPRSPVSKVTAYPIGSQIRWLHYTWKLKPERMELWVRSTHRSPGNDTLAMFMVIPKPGAAQEMMDKMNAGHGTSITTLPNLYYWSRYLNGIRFYFASGGGTYLANLKVLGSEGGVVGAKPTVRGSEGIQVFPNPFHDRITVGQDIDAGVAEFELWSLQGQRLLRTSFTGQAELATGPLPEGMYLYRVLNNGHPVQSGKLVK